MSHTAVLVPGQGSQYVGMGQFLIEEFAYTKQVFEEASDAIGINMQKLCFEGPESELVLTHNTQPAILTVAYALSRVLQSESQMRFQYTAGHSVGEYGALFLAEVMTFADAVKSVRLRGQLMQSAVPVGVGGMAAVMGLTDQLVTEMCQTCIQLMRKESTQSFELAPANFNSPGQVVISGHLSAIEFLKNNLKSDFFPETMRKAKLIPLNVSAPFHCALMKPAEEKMADYLKNIVFKNARFAVVQNYNAHLETDADLIKTNLVKQISGAVKWTDSMMLLKKNGVTRAIECGAGKVLTGLMKKIDPDFEVLQTGTFEDLKNTLQKLSHSA